MPLRELECEMLLSVFAVVVPVVPEDRTVKNVRRMWHRRKVVDVGHEDSDGTL